MIHGPGCMILYLTGWKTDAQICSRDSSSADDTCSWLHDSIPYRLENHPATMEDSLTKLYLWFILERNFSEVAKFRVVNLTGFGLNQSLIVTLSFFCFLLIKIEIVDWSVWFYADTVGA
ncbi:hypothetical protein LIER_01018 [Lithospermum erythrorhizon]|uniref:Uncharacterized protein n=1 Tax=Lithospermum erythrorhizon TaxID=34254 RepID=A0AAV3NJD1_LITER